MHLKSIAFALLSIFGLSGVANAATLTINFKTNAFISGDVQPQGNLGIAAQLILEDDGTNKVKATLKNLAPSGSNQGIVDLALNVNPHAATTVTSTAPSFDGFSSSSNGISAGPAQGFDLGIALKSANNARLKGGQTAVFNLTGTGLTVTKLDALTATGRLAAMHIISIPQSGGGTVSAWIYGEKPQAVPEPATMAALGLGAVAALRRRRAK